MPLSFVEDVDVLILREADRIEARVSALQQQDPTAAPAAWVRAWDWRHRAGRVGAGRVAFRAGRMSAKDEIRFVHSLLDVRLPAEALAAIDNLSEAAGSNVESSRNRGRALMALGRYDEALEIAGRIETAGEPLPEAATWRRIAQRARAVETGEDWAALAAFMTDLAEVRGEAGAAARLARWAPLASTAPPEAGDALQTVATVVLHRLPFKLAKPFVTSLAVLRPKDDAARETHLQWLLRRGEPERAVHVARKRAVTRRFVRSRRIYAEALAAAGQRAEAIAMLGDLRRRTSLDPDVLASLARVIGDDVLAGEPIRFQQRTQRKVFNLIPFNNEIEMLHIRFEEMAPWVDRFVIVEARSTFTGGEKPLHFEANKSQFAAFADKISHVVVDAFPAYVDSAWGRDFHQRDMAVRALNGEWAPDDIVLLTDTDEILRTGAVDGYIDGALALKMQTYRYFLNYGAEPQNVKADGHTGAICTAAHLAEYGASYTRFFQTRTSKRADAISNTGWHFTSVGDIKRVSGKFAAYAHTEKSFLSSEDVLSAAFREVLEGRYDKGWTRYPIDDSFPKYIRDNQAAFGALILPPPSET